MERQRNKEMAPHLIPNQAFFPERGAVVEPDVESEQEEFEVEYEDVAMEQRTNQNAEFIRDLEADLKNRMERNWGLMHSLEKVVEERSMLHSKLQEVERILCKFPGSSLKQKLVDILLEVPDDFKPS